MLYCKGCNCIIVPGRAYLASSGYYCRHCVERMKMASAEGATMKISDERSASLEQL